MSFEIDFLAPSALTTTTFSLGPGCQDTQDNDNLQLHNWRVRRGGVQVYSSARGAFQPRPGMFLSVRKFALTRNREAESLARSQIITLVQDQHTCTRTPAYTRKIRLVVVNL